MEPFDLGRLSLRDLLATYFERASDASPSTVGVA